MRSRPQVKPHRALGAVAGLLIAALVLKAVVGNGGELSGVARLLSHPLPGWVALALTFEALAYVAYAAGQRRLVKAIGRPLSVGWLASLSVAAQALSNFVPVGYVAANVLNFRELRRRDLGAVESAWLLLTTSVLYVGALAALAIAGGEIAGHQGRAGDLRLAAYATLAMVGLSGIAALVLARRGVLGRVVDALLRPIERVSRRGQDHGRMNATRLRSRLSTIDLSWRRASAAGALFLVGWLADAACLVAAIFAVGASPPWTLLLMAYSAAQLVAFLPITPGGLGLVEGSLTVTLAAGGTGGQVLAAVLLYRLISYWGTLPCGLLGYLIVRRASAVRDVPPAEPAGALARAPDPAGLAVSP